MERKEEKKYLLCLWSSKKVTMPMEESKIVNEYTQDGSMDLKGKPVLRSKTGGWKACSFLVGSF